MRARKIDGKKLAEKFIGEAGKYARNNKMKLATILTNNDPASEIYIEIKKRTCNSIGIDVDVIRTNKVEETLKKLNSDPSVTGIIVQLPLEKGINGAKVASLIDPSKDVDGLNPANVGRLFYGDETMPPCTPYGIIKMLESEGVSLDGKKVALIGRSVHIGKPLSIMLTNRNATVTVCHSRTKNLDKITSESDIVVSAVGKAGFLKSNMIKEGAVVIDVGITRVGKKLLGDSDFEGLSEKASLITPVPGGVGPMTVAMLARNIVSAHRMQSNHVKE